MKNNIILAPLIQRNDSDLLVLFYLFMDVFII